MSRKYADIKSLRLTNVRSVKFDADERAHFQKLTRKFDQDIQGFVMKIRTGATICNFGDQLEIQLRDCLMAGINYPEPYQKLLLFEKPTFQSVLFV